jgi:flagellin
VNASDAFQINVNGTGNVTVNLSAGTYTGSQLASHLTAAIQSALSGGTAAQQALSSKVSVSSTSVGSGFALTVSAELASGQTFTLTDGAGTPLAETNLTGAVAAASGSGGVFQVGANATDQLTISIGQTDASTLGVGGLDVVNNPTAAITAIDSAISTVSTTRGNLGAYQNRFESTVNNLQVTTENLAASESRIRDTDMAQEMVNFTRNQVLLQAGTAMLGQANSLPQSVLRLLQ